MKRYSYIIILLVTCMPFFSLAQEKGKPGAGQKAPMTYEAFFKKDMKKVDGIFSVYRDGQKCYLEIPGNSIGKDLLVSGVVTKGQYKGSVSSVTSVLIFNVGRKDQLEVKQQICSDRAGDVMAEAVEASSLQPVLFSYPIVAYGKGKQGYIIDITSDVNATGKLFAFPNQSNVNSPATDRSFLDSVQIIKDGVKFMSLHAQTTFVPGMFGMPGRDQHTSAWIEWSMQQLPERMMAERQVDPRVGYSSISYNDYDENPYKVMTKRIVQRWDLNVRPEDAESYKRGELVEPANPIRVYFDGTFTPLLREAASRGVEEWNRCFEQAGFKNVLQVQTGEPEVGIAYHQIVFSYILGRPSQAVISDARTGEILSGNMCLSNADWSDNSNIFAMQLGGYEPKVFTDSLPVLYTEYFRYCTSNAMGQLLGLIPNMAGSMAFTTKQLRDAAWVRENGISASVTDGCVLNFAVQPGDGICLRDLFSKASVYDRWAIEWGYRQFPGMDAVAEKAALRAIAGKAKNNPALYYAPAKTYGYRVNPYDLGQNKLETAALGIENLKRLSPRLEEIAGQLDKDDSWRVYAELISGFRDQYTARVKVAFDYIENFWQEPIIAGYNDNRMNYLPKMQKQEVNRFFDKYIFSGVPAWLEFSQNEKVNGAKAYGALTFLVMNTSKYLMDPARLTRAMEAQEKAGDKAYTLDDIFTLVDHGVFMDYSASKPVDNYYARMQYNLMKDFLSACVKLNVTGRADMLCYNLNNRAETMTKKFEELGRTHADLKTRQHYRGLAVFMKVKWNIVANAKLATAKK